MLSGLSQDIKHFRCLKAEWHKNKQSTSGSVKMDLLKLNPSWEVWEAPLTQLMIVFYKIKIKTETLISN